jgi:hypothetical protein
VTAIIQYCIFCRSAVTSKREIDDEGYIVICDVCGAIFAVELAQRPRDGVRRIEIIQQPTTPTTS